MMPDSQSDPLPAHAAKSTGSSTGRDALARTIEARLAPMCADWPEEQFRELVERAADIEWRFSHRV